MSCSLVGPCGDGPRLKPGVKMIGTAVLPGSSGFTFVNPRAAGVVLSVGSAWRLAARFAEARNSLIHPLPNECVHVPVRTWFRFVLLKPEPTGTFPPVDAPLLIPNGSNSFTSLIKYRKESVSCLVRV